MSLVDKFKSKVISFENCNGFSQCSMFRRKRKKNLNRMFLVIMNQLRRSKLHFGCPDQLVEMGVVCMNVCNGLT